jgi:hypothetical protein
MITGPRRRSFSPRVTRHFEFTRLQDQLIALAYHTLMPVVSRPLGRPRSRCGQSESATARMPSHRTNAGGA